MAAIDDSTPVLAIYDFRSKQEYIYRTNRMREITGASELMAEMYRRFGRMEVPAGTLVVDGKETSVLGGRLHWDWDGEDVDRKPCEKRELFDVDKKLNLEDGEVGIVVYEGGGNLCVLYRNRAEYVNANRAYSRCVVESAYSLSMIVAGVEWDARVGLKGNLDNVHRRLDQVKRMGSLSVPANVLPYTFVDRTVFQPIVWKEDLRTSTADGSAAETVELTRESYLKRKAFDRKAKADPEWASDGKLIDSLGTKKDTDSLIAIMYFDGNSIGDKLKKATENACSFPEEVKCMQEVKCMREFSTGLHKALVLNTEAAMKKAIDALPQDYRGYRVIVDHGDEITLVCNAHSAPFALDAYFSAIESSGYQACAGIAYCHSHDPFSEVYRIAEECCETGKELNRTRRSSGDEDSSFVDFHHVRSGITRTLDQIRDAQESPSILRPYRRDGYALFLRAGTLLASKNCRLQRSDLKALNRAITRGDSYYRVELQRLEAKDDVGSGGFGAVDMIRAELRKTIESGAHPFAKDVKTQNNVTEPAARTGGSAYETLAAITQDEALRELLYDLTSFWDIYDLRFKSESETEGE